MCVIYANISGKMILDVCFILLAKLIFSLSAPLCFQARSVFCMSGPQTPVQSLGASSVMTPVPHSNFVKTGGEKFALLASSLRHSCAHLK